MIRNGVSHRFDSGGVKVFQPGDKIVVIRAKEAPHESRRDKERREPRDRETRDDESRGPVGGRSR